MRCAFSRTRSGRSSGGRASTRSVSTPAAADYESRAMVSSLPDLEDPVAARQDLFDRIAGLGPLQRLMDDPSVEEIWLNAPDAVYCARSGRSELTGIVLTEEEVQDLVEVMLKSSGRRLDLSMPFVDAALPDGSRLHVAIPDITRRHWAVNIRKFIARARRLDDLVRGGSLTPTAARFLDAAVDAGMNILVSGATQAGKTTLLNCLASAIGPRERVITVEEIFELQIPVRDVVGLQCRQPNLEGHGEIPLRRLVKEALRMRPDRLIVGEVREAEALDMLVALNSGLAGMCTIHANSAADALTKLCTLPLLAGENIVVHCERDRQGRRRVREILTVGSRVEGGVIETSALFQRDAEGDLRLNEGANLEFEALARRGVDVHELVGLR